MNVALNMPPRFKNQPADSQTDRWPGSQAGKLIKSQTFTHSRPAGKHCQMFWSVVQQFERIKRESGWFLVISCWHGCGTWEQDLKDRQEEKAWGRKRRRRRERRGGVQLVRSVVSYAFRHVYSSPPGEKMRARWQSSHSNGISFPRGVKRSQNKFIIWRRKRWRKTNTLRTSSRAGKLICTQKADYEV